MRNAKGQFVKGEGFWTGKKRPGLKTSTTFDKGHSPWNKGKAGSYSLNVNRKGRQFNTGKTHFRKGHIPTFHEILRGKDHPNWGKERIDLRGENNPNWNGGTTSLREQIRKTIRYKEWRFSIFERDNFTCQECKRNKEVRSLLEADHIIPFVALLKIYKILSLDQALECKELWDINNGRTLCNPCHKVTKTYLNREEVRRFYERS